MIAIVDYGVGNLRSVERALIHVGADPKLTADPDDLSRADGLVLPGVGAFAPALEKLTEGGLGRWVVELAGKGKPVLGVCRGYQLLFEESTEHGRHQGLGLLPGRVVEVKDSERLPVIGWCRLTQTDESPLSKGAPATPRVAIPKHNTSAKPNKNIRSVILVSPSLEFLRTFADAASDVSIKFCSRPTQDLGERLA